MKDDACMRWSPGGRQSWRRRRDGGFDSGRYWVREILTGQSKPFVNDMHYARSYPNSRRDYGLFEYETGDLVGVAVLSYPTSVKTIPRAFPSINPLEGADLGRFVLLDRVPANAESWFLGQVREKAAKPSELDPDNPRKMPLRGLVMFSDPVERRKADGTIITPGHVGTIYQASGCEYLGPNGPSTEAILPDGTVFGIEEPPRRSASRSRGMPTPNAGWSLSARGPCSPARSRPYGSGTPLTPRAHGNSGTPASTCTPSASARTAPPGPPWSSPGAATTGPTPNGTRGSSACSPREPEPARQAGPQPSFREHRPGPASGSSKKGV